MAFKKLQEQGEVGFSELEFKQELKVAFTKGVAAMQGLVAEIAKCCPIDGRKFRQLYEHKLEVELSSVTVVCEYKRQKNLQETLLKRLEEVRRTKDTMDNADTLRMNTVKTTRWVTTKTQEHNTLCKASDCNKNCHEKCYLPMTIGNPDFFKKCRAMDGDDICKVCGHRYDLHYHDHYKWEEKTETTTIMNKEETKKYEQAKSKAERQTVFVKALQAQITSAEVSKKEAEASMLTAIDMIEKKGLTSNYKQLL